jgi:hypothetical protein
MGLATPMVLVCLYLYFGIQAVLLLLVQPNLTQGPKT